LKWRLRKINNATTGQFEHLLANETLEPVFKNNFLKISEASFPFQNKSLGKTKDWITQGIKISCRHKRSLYILNRRSNNQDMTAHYNKYSKTLSRVIKEAKRQH
jgi:hypothetical protein